MNFFLLFAVGMGFSVVTMLIYCIIRGIITFSKAGMDFGHKMPIVVKQKPFIEKIEKKGQVLGWKVRLRWWHFFIGTLLLLVIADAWVLPKELKWICIMGVAGILACAVVIYRMEKFQEERP